MEEREKTEGWKKGKEEVRTNLGTSLGLKCCDRATKFDLLIVVVQT